MERQNAEAAYASIRFPNGGGFAVGPVEMDRAGRVLFRVLVPNGNGMCSHTRVILEGASAERMRKVFIAGLASRSRSDNWRGGDPRRCAGDDMNRRQLRPSVDL
jgi:hypothetical protein